MTPRVVRFTSTAQEHVRREKGWWLENRTHVDIFAAELGQALNVLGVLPGAGTSYSQAGVVGLRRIYLRKAACHIYYPSMSTKSLCARFGEPGAAKAPSSNHSLPA